MGTLRFLIRFPALFAWSFLLWFIRMAFYPMRWINEERDRRWRRWWFRKWAQGIAVIFGMRLVVKGPRPQAPFYLVSNHLSYMDIFVLTSQTGCGFVARGDVEHWPVMGFMCKSLYILFIDREKKRDAARVNDLISHALDMGDGITVFAESRISRGIDVEPFKSALIQPAVAIGTPVHYAAITYHTPEGALPANQIVGWWRPEPMVYHLRRLLAQPGFTATVHFGPEPIAASDRKELCRRLHVAVREVFEPVG